METSPVYQAAFNFLDVRRQLKDAKQVESTLQQQVLNLRGVLNDAMTKARTQTTDNPEQDDLFDDLTSFAVLEGDTCTMLVFCDNKLHSIIEGPIVKRS